MNLRLFGMLGVLSGTPLFPQGTDLIDTQDLAGRAISFEGKEGVALGLPDVNAIGDVNGDGVSDIALIHKTGTFEDVALSFYVILGGSQWIERNTITPKLENSARFWEEDWEATGLGHTWIGNVGDLNGDGLAEFAFSATSYAPQGIKEEIRGVLFIVYGEAEFEHYSVELWEITNGNVPGTMIYNTSSSPTEHLTGRGGAIVVDLNGDGQKDLVTAGTRKVGTSTSGIVYVLTDPRNLGARVDLNDLGKTIPGFRLSVPGLPDTLSNAGDFDGDRFDDLLINGNTDNSLTNSAWLFYGRANPEGIYALSSLGETGNGVQRFLPPTTPEDAEYVVFGGSGQVSGVGDLNGDGLDDILLGESYNGWGGSSGRVYLIYGGLRWTQPLPIDEVPVGRRRVFHGLGGIDRSDHFGGEVAGPGDINGDGIPDLLMSASTREDEAGEGYLLYGRREFPEHMYLSEGFDGIRVVGTHTDGALGYALDSAGDFNADGNQDFLMGEPQLSSFATGGSRAIIIFGTGNGTPPLHAGHLEPKFGFQRGGSRVRVHGTGFQAGVQVYFGEKWARVIEVTPTGVIVESPPASVPTDVPVMVNLGERKVTARDLFEYIPDRPEIDLQNPGRWGLRIDDEPGVALGLSLAFADIDGNGIDDLLVGSDFLTDWVVTVVHGGRSLPEVMGAFAPGSAKSQIWKRSGEPPRGFFDVSVRAVGDINGDGIADMGAAALSESTYLFFGRRNLETDLDFDAEVQAGRAVRLLCDQSVGRDFAPMGDLTGDRIDDFALSVAFRSVVFIEGRRDWPAELDVMDENEGSIFSRLTREDTNFAVQFAAAGDVNGDGYRDLLVSGESFRNLTVYLVYARPAAEMPGDSIIDHYIEAGGGVLFEWEPREASSGSLAITVAGVGDSNGDGIDDFVVGDQQGTVGAVFQGVSYLIHGRQDFPWRVTLPYAMGSPITTEEIVRLGAQDIDQSGRCVGSAGDYNGDGHPDFLIGSQGNASIDFEMPGRMHVVFGGSDLPPTLDLASLGRHGFRLEGIRPVTWMTVASLNSGDLNDDGAADFAFTEVSSPYWQLEDGSMPPGSVHVVYGIPPSVPFIRGDADGDGRLNITDGVFTLSHLFLGGVNPLCEDATDTDDRGTVELTDAVYFLNHLFLGGPEPPAPYPTPGDDPTEDGLGCRGF